MTAITVSVIICTWNRAGLLRETLASLAMQQHVEPSAVEVIVIDNNSTDATKETVNDAMKDWPLGQLRYEFEPRQGKQFALNLGVSVARAPVLAFTDDDILFPTDWLLRIQELFADPGVMLAGGKTLIAWGSMGRPKWFADDMLAIVAGVDLGDERLDPAPETYSPGGSNLIARKQLFDRIGGYSETHFRHMDFEFGMRSHARGERVVYDPRLVVRAPVDEKSLTLHYFRRWSFKAGLGRSGGIDAVGQGFPRVPVWIYRQALEDWLATRLKESAEPSPERFSRELRMWRLWGTISNAWHAWLRPSQHSEWVKRKSQKTANLY